MQPTRALTNQQLPRQTRRHFKNFPAIQNSNPFIGLRVDAEDGLSQSSLWLHKVWTNMHSKMIHIFSSIYMNMQSNQYPKNFCTNLSQQLMSTIFSASLDIAQTVMSIFSCCAIARQIQHPKSNSSRHHLISNFTSVPVVSSENACNYRALHSSQKLTNAQISKTVSFWCWFQTHLIVQ